MCDTQLIEGYILNELKPQDNLLVEARLLVEPDLAEKLRFQKQSYELVNAYGRQKLLREIETVHKHLFTANSFAGFREKIKSIFS